MIKRIISKNIFVVFDFDTSLTQRIGEEPEARTITSLNRFLIKRSYFGFLSSLYDL